MAPSGSARYHDWVFSSGSNAHLANHLEWFTYFTPFNSETAQGSKVLGVGTVEIPAALPGTPDETKYNMITLVDVLYVPSAICNVIGVPIMDSYTISGGIQKLYKGDKLLGTFDKVRLPRLRIAGQRSDQTVLDKNTHYWINATWDPAERARWQAAKAAGAHNTTITTTQSPSGVPPYSAEEKQWLKENFKNEFEFLRTHGLSIHKEEDREEGRLTARALMLHDDDESEEDMEEEEDEEDEEDDFLAEIERDPTSHVADYAFSESELDWIKKHWGHSGNFLLSYGLKPWDDEACQEGKAIVRAMMADDDEDEED